MKLYVPAEEGEQGLGMVVRKATDSEIVAALANGERVEAETLLQSGWFVQVPERGEYVVVPVRLLVDYPKEGT